MVEKIEITPLDVNHASQADLIGYYEVAVASQSADRPDEELTSFDEFVGRLRNPFLSIGPQRHWLARRGTEIVGTVSVYFLEEENENVALTTITVHPRLRRRGMGTWILRALLPELRAQGREVIEGWQLTAGGAGALWAAAVGFDQVKTMLLQALVFADVDAARWDVDVPAGYRLDQWHGAAPSSLVGSYAMARMAIDDAPVGGSAVLSPRWTAARVREAEADLAGRGVEHRVVVAVHVGTGEVVGFTEVELYPYRPTVANQRDTAVLHAHRGYGLGRCLKARMVKWLRVERPVIERVHTATSAANIHMIRVNHEIGFETVRTVVAVNRDIEALESAIGPVVDA